MADLRGALAQLPEDQREPHPGRGIGFSYEEAAEICNVAVGTIKSRVNRARARLTALMHIDTDEKFGPDAHAEAVLGSSHRS